MVTHSFEETILRGREIGSQLKPPVLVLLSGDLGAGKTTLTKGIARGLDAASEDEVTSPTFTLSINTTAASGSTTSTFTASPMSTILRRWVWRTCSPSRRS
jgi:tRNA A37 threonylcarbamoyladenosine biosynthesis protein TsaE